MMKSVLASAIVLGLLFSSAAVHGATLTATDLAHVENKIAERIDGLCSSAQQVDEAGLRELEKLVAAEIKRGVELEENARKTWRGTGDSVDRKHYLEELAVATAVISLYSRVRQCIEARRITTKTPYLNVCQTNQGPLGCAGQFTGLYKSRCVRPMVESDQGSGTLTVSADGTVRLKLESKVFNTGGSDEVSGIMDLTGAVIIDESSQERKIRYDGRFTVKSDPGPLLTGEPRLSGGGTYIYSSSAISCDGEFRLHDY
jgi:hypothetical protein